LKPFSVANVTSVTGLPVIRSNQIKCTA